MKKYGLRILVGLIAFGIGLSAVIWEVSQTNYCKEQNEFSSPTYTTSPNGKIEVSFIGFGNKKNRPTLKFKVINNTPFVINNFTTGSKRFNGKEIENVWNGLCRFPAGATVNSGDFFVEEFFADKQIYEFMRKKGKFEFEFTFSIDNYQGEIWSEPIMISEEMKQDFIQNAPNFLKRK